MELLWPGGAPGAKGDSANDKPEVQVYLPDAAKANGTCVVVCPGGGYAMLAMKHEGHDVAVWLNSLGATACVLKYRHHGVGYGHPAPLLDAQRAMRLVRHKGKEWNVDPQRVGILGFSAGGHLASSAATHFDKGNEKGADAVDRLGCRPDFAVLAYPVISFVDACTHQGSKRNLLGADPDPKLVEHYSSERQVTAETPPTFLMHTGDDAGVPVENSLLFYAALRKHKVPAELHVYAHGQHGLGLAPGVSSVSAWPEACAQWLRTRKLLDAK